MSVRPYPVRLHLNRSSDESIRGGRFDVELVDEDRASTSARGTGIAFLDLRTHVIPGIDLGVGEMLDNFFRGDGGTQEDGLCFGRYLLERLFDKEVRVLWDEIQARREAEKRPLRLELLLPADDAGVVSDIPFELLADDKGFLFRRSGASLVRGIRRLPARSAEIASEDTVLVAWANPKTDKVIPQSVFDRHEQGTAREAEKLGLRVKAPCRRATRVSLAERLAEGGGTTIASLVAHGDMLGGVVYLHGDPSSASDPPDPVEARDLAHVFRLADVRVALLWSCHGSKQNAISGAVAATLLDPAHGDVSAVVASHAALRAESTADVVERLFASLKAPAGGDLERAVSEARHALRETDLQWAAPVYYARPEGGRTVNLVETLEKAAESLRVTEAPRPGELEGAPRPWPHFRGREDEIARGIAYLRTGRLLSITGMPGMGKTETALAIAREAASDPTLALSKARWVAVDGLSNVDAVRARLSFAFGAEPKDCPDDAALARRIGDVRVLLVLDNAEDVLRSDRAGARALVATLLRACPGLTLLLATREKFGDLREADEHEIRVTTLGKKEAREVFVSVAGERLTAEEQATEAFDSLLAWLDGHPLSLVLVAKQVGSRPLPDLLRRLETLGAQAVQAAELFGEEPGSDRNERLTRLVSSLELSYRPLVEKAPGAAEMFAWLGYFPGGLPGVLISVVFEKDGEEQRATLLRKGLAEESGRENRLGLPAPVRAYARARAAELSEARRLALVTASFAAMAGWMTALHMSLGKPAEREAMETAGRDGESVRLLLGVVSTYDTAPDPLSEQVSQVVEHWAQIMSHAGRVLEPERATIAIPVVREAITTIERLGHNTSVAKLLQSLDDLHAATHQHRDTRTSTKMTPPQHRSIGDQLGSANSLQTLGDLYLRADRLKDAESAYDQALIQFRAINEPLGEVNALNALGNLYLRSARLREAEQTYNQALHHLRTINEPLGEANVLKALGDLYIRTDRLKDAELAYDQALGQFHAINEPLGEANALKALGDLYLRTARLKDAELVYEQALSQSRAIDDRLGEANVLQALGDLYLRTDRLKDAELAYDQTLSQFRAIDESLGEANVLKALGDLYLRTDRLQNAELVYEQALSQCRAIEERLGEANVLKALGDLYLRTARLKDAKSAYDLALSIFRAIEERLGEANVLQALGDVYLRTARLIDAERSYDLALSIFRAIEERLGEANVLQALGDVYLRTARLNEAERYYDLALSRFRTLDAPLGEANVLQALGDLYFRAARLEDAERAYDLALPKFRSIDERLGEANLLKALGDLYLRTARLEDAERAYDLALPKFRTIGERLGEANLLDSLGNLALTKGTPDKSLHRYLEALRLHQEIGNDLGVASAHLYMARASLAANRPDRAVALLRSSLSFYASLDDHFDLLLSFIDLIRALNALSQEEPVSAAIVLAWHHAAIIEHPLAKQLAEHTGSANPPSAEDVAQAQALVTAVLDEYDTLLRERGEDLYSPLTP